MNNSPVEFEFDEFKFEGEEDQENKPEESDEDTEDASEADIGNNEGPVEIKEQMYQDKLAFLKKKLQQLKEGTHPEFNQKISSLREEYQDRLQMNKLHSDYLLETIEKEYSQEKKAAVKEFEEKKIDLKENLISDLEDKKKTIESERFSWELTGDPMEVKPVMTRKLRRRPNDPVPVPEKRRKIQTTQITHLLDEKEIEHDLKLITRGKLSTPTRKRSDSASDAAHVQNASVPAHSAMPFHDLSMVEARETRIEEGKLLYERRWFHRGQSVFVESKDASKFPGNISAIGSDAIWVKKSDGTKVKIYLTNLARDMSDTSQNLDQINEQGSVFSIVCRICYDADSNEELITPCRCKGTVAFVHRSCLETWLAEANATNCELCHQAFHTERTPKYTTCQSLWRWLRYQPTANEVGRGIVGDMLACAAITPMAVVITYVCLFSSDYYNQKKFQALTAAKWTSVSLLVMIGIMLVGYYMWVFSIIKLHMTVWYNWWQRECIVRYIPPTSTSRIAPAVRMNRRENTVITILPQDRNLDTTDIIDVETVDSKPRLAIKPHKTTSPFFFGKKRVLPTIEERDSETVINIVQSSSRNMNLFLSSTSRIVVESEDTAEGGEDQNLD